MLRCLVSALFLALPLGTTIGILLGIQAYRAANGQPPPFSGGDDGPGLPGIVPANGKDSLQMYCDQSYGYSPQSKNQNFILNPNPWGWKEGQPGDICMLINFNGNRTYATPYSAPVFNVTWSYPQVTDPNANNVHAFPNAQVDSKNFPVQLSAISKLEFDLEWHLSTSNDSATAVDLQEGAAGTNANVAIDMFMDSNKAKSQDSQDASYEVMVWFAAIGPAAQPLGKNIGPVTTAQLDGDVQFTLYADNNSKGQMVLTWVTPTYTHTFNGSIYPLFDAIFKLGNQSYPNPNDYLGYVAFGQEAFDSVNNVTFAVPRLSVDVETS